MKSLLTVFVSFALFMSGAVMAETKVAVLDMELRDLTLEVSDPKKRAEIAANDQENLALTQSLIREGVEQRDHYQLVKIDAKAQKQADKGVGFLFDRPDAAANLGQQYDADYVVVGRYHKPSYLFSYIMLRVVDVDTGKMLEEFKTEVKGRAPETIPRNIDNVMKDLDALLSSR